MLNGKSIVLVGYDIEARSAYGDSKSTRLFLEKAVPMHKTFGIPCTGFVLGQTLLENVELFQKVCGDPLWNIEQHTLTHVPFRNVEPLNEKWKSAEGVSIDIIKREISQASGMIQEILGIPCKGICTPKGYFNGLRGRADILGVLRDNSIEFVRSYARNKDDWMPVSFDVQPFWYGEDGFPEILEVPAQGWQDIIWRRTFGWSNKPGFLRYLKESVNYIVENQLVWSCGFHDWSCIREDPELNIIKGFFEYALKRGVIFMSHLDFFEMMKKGKDEYGYSTCRS